jgi:signal transduction histidine kinase
VSFRLKLFLSIAVAVLLTALVEGVLDFVYDNSQARLQTQTDRELRQYVSAVLTALELEGGAPSLVPGAHPEAPANREGRFRVMMGDELWLSGEAPFPESEVAWARHARHLGNGYRLEVALERTLGERIVSNYLLLDLLDLPLFFALTFGVAWLLTRFVMFPIRELTVASEQLAKQQYSAPISVPTGDDELSRMARSFNVMSVSIQGLLERERTFTRYASHELRTPLSALKVQVERAELGLAPAETVMPVLSRNVARMEEVLSALLALARSEERDTERTPLRPLIQELLTTFPQEARRRASLRFETDSHVWVTDARLVHHALRNLLENAFRYGSGHVAVNVATCGERVTVRVSDTGPGVPEELLGKLTKPFFRAGKHSESLGLGLSLVENIVRSLRGTLELKNTGRGLEAVLILPVAGPEPRSETGSEPSYESPNKTGVIAHATCQQHQDE